jgi:uncharacterized membrane protein YgcG
MLDRLQTAYNRSIVFSMRRKPLTVVLGLAAVAAGVLMLQTVPQQFFPSAERNQFVIDVWMPRNARIEATAATMGRIERVLAGKAEVAHYAAFVGRSAPRFYYNVSPQDPDPAYGQFIVDTKDEKTVPALVSELRRSLAEEAPEALAIVKELQQGMTMEAPIEVRISGYGVAELQRIGTGVEKILHQVPYAQSIYNDYFGDSGLVDVDIDTEVSNRLGLTNASVSGLLAGAFSGDPVGTFWEGNRAITILLRLEAARRSSFEDVRNAYVPSAITHASVPLRSIAQLTPQWQTSRIVRRNGVRTLTVRAFPQRGHYASQVLNAIDRPVKALALPAGYRLEYGGEITNRNETLPMMTEALAISLVAIFLVLLMQFRNLSEPLLVMCSIPLAMFGAMLGLVLTRNPFGFTAFTGMIALSGIVVRNAIILVDYINEKLREGHSLEAAAIEAGERRLRPIFLTTMAAAVGVTPMIISGSSLWSPLASVIAVGLVSSMFFTLIVVPVLFVLVKSHGASKPAAGAGAIIALLLALLLTPAPARAASRQLTLPEAVDLALKQNSALKIARARVRENRQKEVTARADYFPQLANSTNLWGLSDRELVTIPAGSLGAISGIQNPCRQRRGLRRAPRYRSGPEEGRRRSGARSPPALLWLAGGPQADRGRAGGNRGGRGSPAGSSKRGGCGRRPGSCGGRRARQPVAQPAGGAGRREPSLRFDRRDGRRTRFAPGYGTGLSGRESVRGCQTLPPAVPRCGAGREPGSAVRPGNRG